MKIFIGSSKEAFSKAEDIAANIARNGHEPKMWTDASFIGGKYVFECLEDIAQSVDAAIFVFNEDDKQWYRGIEVSSVRDNILIEYGLFGGVLGRQNVLICTNGKPKIASDLSGIIYISLDEMNQAKVDLRNWLEHCSPKRTIKMGELINEIYSLHKTKQSKPEETIKKWDGIIAECPECVRAKIDKAWVYFEQGESRKAAYLIEEAGNIFNCRKFYYIIGLAYKAALEYERAIRNFDTCVLLDKTLNTPMSWYAHMSHKKLGEIYTSMKNNDEAQKHYKLSEEYQ